MSISNGVYSAAKAVYWIAETVVIKVALPLVVATANKVAEIWKAKPVPARIVDDEWEEIQT